MQRSLPATLLLAVSLPAFAAQAQQQTTPPAQPPAEAAAPPQAAASTTPDTGTTTPPKDAPDQVHVSSAVMQSQLIHSVGPVYPVTAKINRITGVVVVQVVITKDGSVTNPQIISGPPMLQQAAIDAVKQWKYKPTRINGAPVEVLTRLNINFTLNGR